jgi:flagellar biosynthesis/type III secretory pathway M-ring protein FliF/YscJ
MNAAFVQQHWALLVASVLIVAIVLFVIFRLMQDSRRGRLAEALGHMRERERALAAVSKSIIKASARLEKLQAKGDSVPPGKVLAAKDALQEARETEKLLNEQVLVVRNNARLVILEDYPTKHHEAMCRKYLGETR